jgi:hypothetical protein
LAKEVTGETITAGTAKPAAPTSGTLRPLTAQSLFRPASTSYNFAQRLSEALSAAEANARG